MTEKTFTFTIKQIKDIYRAGIRRGEEVQSAYDWGSSSYGTEIDNCVEAVCDIINEGIGWDDEKYTDFSTVEKWFKESK
jgi:Holliday junction resolvase RusA-like endonuclease